MSDLTKHEKRFIRKGSFMLGFSMLFAAMTVVGITVATAAPAYAADNETELTNEIVDRLGSDDIVVIEPAKLSNLELLEDKMFYSYFSVVAVNSVSLDGYDPAQLADFILNENGYDNDKSISVLVVNSKAGDEIYVSAVNNTLEKDVITLLGGVGASSPINSDDAGWDILRNSDAIYDLQKEMGGDMPLWGVLLIMPGMIVIPLAIWGIIYFIIRLRRNRRRTSYTRRIARQRKLDEKRYAKETKIQERAEKARAAAEAKEQLAREANAAPVTPELDLKLNKLLTVAKDISADDTKLSSAVVRVYELFTELREAITLMDASDAKRGVLYVEYGARFDKLITLIGPKYYQDIKNHPNHWRDADGKLKAIRKSFDSTADQILESIIQLKEGSEFEFEISIESILGFKVASPKDMLDPRKK